MKRKGVNPKSWFYGLGEALFLGFGGWRRVPVRLR